MLLTAIAAPSGAIVGGQPDEGRHPYVGGTVLFFPPRNETIVNCTGSLISPTVFRHRRALREARNPTGSDLR
jgi:hypothetical protein